VFFKLLIFLNGFLKRSDLLRVEVDLLDGFFPLNIPLKDLQGGISEFSLWLSEYFEAVLDAFLSS
jgi:hypothetical protein